MNLSTLQHYLISATLILALLHLARQTFVSQTDQFAVAEAMVTTEGFCASDQLLEAAIQQNENVQNRHDQLESAWQSYITNQGTTPVFTPPEVILPVVFHVIHNNGPENIADAVVLEGLDRLNQAFANETPYDPNTGVNTDIQFCLAQEDPDGNPSTGINHVQSTLTEVTLETEDVNMKDVSRWDPTRYINIWIVKEICSSSAGCGVAGYAYFPSSHGNPEDGLVVEAQWLGSSPGDAAVLAHEMGHYLGLYHTFQNGCANNNCLMDGDRVCDTPPDQSIVATPCNLSANSCTSDVNSSDPNNPFTTDQNDMFWNYMDYGEWDCYSAFTAGQTERMMFFINGARVSLLDEDLCSDPCPNPIILQVAPGDTIVDIGTTLTFTNTTLGATSFEWQVNGTLVGTNTNLTFNFSPEGTYLVSLTAFNGDTLCSATLDIIVIAIDCEGNAHVSDSNGTDAPGCGVPGSPCQTIQYALDNIVCSGDTVFIHSDTYQLAAGTDPLTPIATIPENYSVTFYGVEDNGPVIIDGNNERRGFQYSYFGGSCPEDNPNDGIPVSNAINFAHLTIQNTYFEANFCGNTNQAKGGGIQIYNSVGSDLEVSVRHCRFNDNFLEDPVFLNNNGRSVSGAAIFVHGLVSDQNTSTTAKVWIDGCDFNHNRCHQQDNGGHGGAVCIVNVDTALVSNSYFCNNEVHSDQADAGDTQHDRNAGGALLFFDTNNQFPGHEFWVDDCSFVGNTATTTDGIGFPNNSEGGAIFLTRGDNLAGTTSATLRVSNSHFYDNNIEPGIEHIDNNGGTLDLTSIGNNVFADTLGFTLGPDTTLCSGTPLFATFYPGATYEWSTGDTTTVIIVDAPGLYSVTVSLGQCSVSDEINIGIENCGSDCEDTWFQTLGDPLLDEGGLGMIPSGDGNFYVKGFQDDNILLMKMTPEGALLWSRTFKLTTQPRERLYELILDSEGFLIGAGNSGLTTDLYEGFVFKYDPANDILLWSSEINSEVRVNAVLDISPTENYRLLGIKWDSPLPGNDEDAYMITVDRNTGAMTGEVNISYASAGNTDAFLDALFYNSSIYGVGVSVVNSNFGGFRPMICKTDPSGNILWSKNYLLPLTSTARLYGSKIVVDQDSLVTIHYGDVDGTVYLSNQIFLSKSDIDGNNVWAKAYEMPIYSELFSQEIIVLEDGYLVGAFNRAAPVEIALLKTDKDGVLQWAKRYATSGELDMDIPVADNQIFVDNDRIYIVGRSLDVGSSVGNVLLIKTDMEGNLLTPCPFIDTLAVNETDLAPFDEDINLTAYTSPLAIASPPPAQDTTTILTAQSCYGPCTEICDNGIDDDGDNLIDCFDPDCCDSEACVGNYYADCEFECSLDTFPFTDIELEVEWTSNGNGDWCSYNTPITGDIDGDGVPEIIGKPCTGATISGANPYPNLLIVDGSTGLIEDVINTPAFYYLMDGPAIADVDNDGFAEIFVQASNHIDNINYTGGGPIISGNVQRRLLCYEYDGSTYVERWMSDVPTGYSIDKQAISVSVADFNEDGIPEIYTGTQVFNSLTGELLVEGGPANHFGAKPIGDAPSLASAFAVAADFLPDDFCLTCPGLELVAGGMVYSVHLDPLNAANNMMNVEVSLPGALDGWTSIADLDKDGDLDAVVTTINSTDVLVYTWDVQTATSLTTDFAIPGPFFGYISQTNIADFDGDQQLEIGVCTPAEYRVLKPNAGNLDLLWMISISDFSGSTGSSVFDFNNDGINEVVYRDEIQLQILDGATGTVISALPCASGTRVEYPVVVDVDADGETEILCSCANTLTAYGSASTPWIDTRSVWNQHNYFNVNINDDLTVSAEQQLHHIVGDSVVLNNFLTMYGADESPLPDATIHIDSFECIGDLFAVTLTICNIGDNTLSQETPITFYESDPTITTANDIGMDILGQNLLPDSCTTIVIDVAALFDTTLYAVVNDNASLPGPYDLATDFPVTAIAECDYTNNLDSLMIGDLEPPELDLGPDTLICDNGVLTLNAGSGWDSYEWFDGTSDSTVTVFGPGEYWVEVTGFCGAERDTIEVDYLPITVIELPDTLPICGVDCITLEVADWYDAYEWIPSDYLDCDTCSTVEACPPGPMTYTVIGSSLMGCYSIDTVTLVPIEPTFTQIDTAVCLGDVVIFDGMELPIGSTDTFFIPGTAGCLDTVVVNVGWNGSEHLTVAITAVACENESIIYNGVEIPAGGSETFEYVSFSGCDSIEIVDVFSLPTYNIDSTTTICQGDSVLIFGNYESEEGTYSMTFTTAEFDCDSTVNITLEFFPTFDLSINETPTCAGNTEGELTAMATGGAGGFTYLWENGETTPTITGLAAGAYDLTVTDANNCSQVATGTVSELTLDPTLETDDATCFGEMNGMVTVTNPQPDWMYGLNGGSLQTAPFFDNLAAGEYTLVVVDGNGCEVEQGFEIEEPPAIVVTLVGPIQLTVGEETVLTPILANPGGYLYQWSPPEGLSCTNCEEPTVSGITEPTTYTLTVTAQSDSTCFDTASVLVIPFIDCDGTHGLPNAFTPDGDGINDVFQVLNNGIRDVQSFLVFDRWGENVYNSSGLTSGWDGTHKDKPMPPDVYIYAVTIICPEGEERVLKGEVTLIR